jgi:hypothetical protein
MQAKLSAVRRQSGSRSSVSRRFSLVLKIFPITINLIAKKMCVNCRSNKIVKEMGRTRL